jgi:hypothetical protein
MASSIDISLFPDRYVCGEFVSRLLRASHCRSCVSLHLLAPTFIDAMSDPSIREFLLLLHKVLKLETVIGSPDVLSWGVESYRFDDSLDAHLSAGDRRAVLCQLRYVMSHVADIFYEVEFANGKRQRRRRVGNEIAWKEKVIPLLESVDLRFYDVFRHRCIHYFLSSIGDDNHGRSRSGCVFGGAEPTFLHFMASFKADDEVDSGQLDVFKLYDLLDAESLDAKQPSIGQKRKIDDYSLSSQRDNDQSDPNGGAGRQCKLDDILNVRCSQQRCLNFGSAAFVYRRLFAGSVSGDPSSFCKKSSVFHFLYSQFKAGPEYRDDTEFDVGAPIDR